MESNSNHIGLQTDSSQTLIRFYTEKLGFEKGETRTIPKDLMDRIFGLSWECRMTKLRFGRVILEIFSPENMQLEKKSVNSKGLNHWGLEVENRETFILECEQKGVDLLKIDRNGRFIYFIKDPDGNLIEIFGS